MMTRFKSAGFMELSGDALYNVFKKDYSKNKLAKNKQKTAYNNSFSDKKKISNM